MEVKSSVPRGFSRYYTLHLLKEKPMTGKEIMEEAERRSEGKWKPSAGLIYPLLGRLQGDGLIAEVEESRFTITAKGEKTLNQYAKFQAQIEKQRELIRQLGLQAYTTSKFVFDEAMDRLIPLTTAIREDLDKHSSDMRKNFLTRYKAFLKAELKRIEQEKKQVKDKQ